ncbi:hypothetical protein [Actinoplanes italicus]|uniref:Ricin-type beta-trefoil lectin protein n=1 Tax=Actinoplanes italicus TaxID=113567 RepID=A0A2T0KMR6_9ACTN|nr:hypothetical protein [Actinoplanes italicus]PRX24928.1 hypothetical protein CLV67_102711 [Actinoplanes italicus]
MSRIGAVIAGTVLVGGLAGCTSTDGTAPINGPDPAGPSPSSAATAGPGADIRGNRQFLFATVDGGKALTVDADGLLTVAGKSTGRSLFVTTPLAPGSRHHLLQTARMTVGDEPWCLQVHDPGGSRPLQLKTEACDAAEKNQVFTFPTAPDGRGRLIEVNGLFVLADTGDGRVMMQQGGEGDAMSSFTVTDKGESTLPHPGD